MTDQTADADEPTPGACPWCSAELPAADATTCPSCGATPDERGRARPTSRASPRSTRSRSSRPAPVAAPATGSCRSSPATRPSDATEPTRRPIARPADDDVRREMLRLELEARADLEAEAVALKADVIVEQGADPDAAAAAIQADR